MMVCHHGGSARKDGVFLLWGGGRESYTSPTLPRAHPPISEDLDMHYVLVAFGAALASAVLSRLLEALGRDHGRLSLANGSRWSTALVMASGPPLSFPRLSLG